MCQQKRICKREKYIEIGRVRDRFIGSGKESHYLRRGKEEMENKFVGMEREKKTEKER